MFRWSGARELKAAKSSAPICDKVSSRDNQMERGGGGGSVGMGGCGKANKV